MQITDRIILSGLANNKTSLGEIFRRYIECFKQFSNPDIFDLGQFIGNDEVNVALYPSYKGKIDHNIRYVHSTFHLYNDLLAVSRPKCSCCRVSKTDHKKIGYFVWESSDLPEDYISCLSDFDEIWTASEYCKDIFSQYISSSNIKIIKHPVPFPLKNYKKYEKMTVLIIGNISSDIDRKNTLENIKIANIAKQKYPELEIIFKTFSISDSERDTISYIRREHDLIVIDEYYDSLQLQELIARSHIILSLHRSEGFGLCLAEGIPFDTIPLATGYSGNIDFMPDSRLKVDYKLVDIHHSYFKGQWAEPNYEDAIDKLYSIIDNYGNIKYDFSNINEYNFSNVTSSIKNTL